MSNPASVDHLLEDDFEEIEIADDDLAASEREWDRNFGSHNPRRFQRLAQSAPTAAPTQAPVPRPAPKEPGAGFLKALKASRSAAAKEKKQQANKAKDQLLLKETLLKEAQEELASLKQTLAHTTSAKSQLEQTLKELRSSHSGQAASAIDNKLSYQASIQASREKTAQLQRDLHRALDSEAQLKKLLDSGFYKAYSDGYSKAAEECSIKGFREGLLFAKEERPIYPPSTHHRGPHRPWHPPIQPQAQPQAQLQAQPQVPPNKRRRTNQRIDD